MDARTGVNGAAVEKPPVDIRVEQADGPDKIETVTALFREYQASLGLDLEFQGFEEELANLPGEYAPPRGRLFVATVHGMAAGCIAMRPIDQAACEMKRLYTRPTYRGLGMGRGLAQRLIAESRLEGYSRMLLDTLPSMHAAQALYRSLGFREVSPYRFNPVEGACYMELDL